MTYLPCRNRVSDFARRTAVFMSHPQAHRDAGLVLVNLWRGVENSAEGY